MEDEEGQYKVKILGAKGVTHDVRRFKTSRPEGYEFVPGQATELSINRDGLRGLKRPFTFTSLPGDDFLEFTIKMYEEHVGGVTRELKGVGVGDSFLIGDSWGAIQYSGKGVFIAGGAGITPFISILRDLRGRSELEGNTLIFSNKTEKDIINKEEFDEMGKSGLRVLYTLTREGGDGFDRGRVSEVYLKEKIKDFGQKFYICGPVGMVGEIQSVLRGLGASAESVVVES